MFGAYLALRGEAGRYGRCVWFRFGCNENIDFFRNSAKKTREKY
jgi:hypothetical protein